jgi:hypothetical protein
MITNNDIMKKLRIALSLRDTDIIEILKLAQFETTPAELSAIFRAEGQPQYVPCGDQILRRFLDGLIIKYRGVRERKDVKTGAPVRGSSKQHRVVRQDRSLAPAKPDTIRVYRADGA